MAETKGRRLTRPALFVCDIQEKFRGQIWEYEKVIATTQKLLKAAEILNIPVYATTQNAARLGDTCSELTLPSSTKVVNKTAFSMYIPPISSAFPTKTQGAETQSEVAIVGIESHICITQTTLDLLKAGHKVYIIADGVSSCNRQEVPIALDRLTKEGAVVTTSESWMYECMGDAGIPEFKAIAKLVKETSASTKNSMETLLSKI